MSEVLIDVTRLLNRFMMGRLPTGVDRVSLEYVRHFSPNATALVRVAERWIEFRPQDSVRIFEALLAPGKRFNSLIRWYVVRNHLLKYQSKNPSRVLLNTGHSGLDQASYSLQLKARSLRPVFFLHDIIPITHPEYCRSGEADKHHLRLETMIKTGRGLIVNSQATLVELNNYAANLNLQLPPCKVAPLAPAALPVPDPARPLAEPFFVILGTIESRKNHLLLLNIWRQLIQEMGGITPRLVVIGQRGWESEQAVDMLERCDALKNCVIEVPGCSDNQLSTWLYHAQALLFPSFTEGFGMPLVEALSIGLPVIASDLPAFREFAGDVPEYLDPIDGLGWKRLILAYSDVSNPLRLAQIDRMRSFSAPTWQAHFVQVDTLLNTLND